MRILGIETSCDESAAAIVEDGVTVLASVISSQVDIHAKTGGVVPEVAAREHVLKVLPVIDEALQSAKLRLEDIDAFAFTRGPGLLSSLVIGFAAADTLARTFNKPLIPVNHIAGHIHANWLERASLAEISYPLVVLTVSGGHNELILMKGETDYTLLGETLDDAAGEAFDKVARLLGLAYPGGPAIAKAATFGNAKAIDFPRAMWHSGDYDFSFSGIKTAVLQHIQKTRAADQELTTSYINDCAASFQECVTDILSEKLLRAAEQYAVKEIHLAGGVSANTRLREITAQKMQNKGLGHLPLRYTKLCYCTDNAAMIAGVASLIYKRNPLQCVPGADNPPDPQLSLHTKQ